MVIERSPSPSEIVQETPFVEEPVVEQVPVEVIQPEPEPVVVEQKIDREDYVSKLKILLEQKEKLGARNAQLQNRLGEHFKRKRADDSRDGEKSVLDQEQRYASVMQSLSDYKAEAEAINSTNRRIVEENKAKLEERLLEAKAKTDEFNKYKRQISMSAENSRTGKALPLKIIEQLEATERKKESDVVAVRLENIKLRNKLRRHEQLLRQKEELADGLHLIDFEQLKIENQTFNEKIEERNEELLKLRKKITNVVQVLTHVKEKLQFVQAEATDLKATLKDVDKQVTAKRDLLPILKQSRDAIRNANTVLRQKNGLLGNSNLLRDYGNKVDSVRALNGRIEQLKGQYNDLTEETQRLRRKMQKNALVQQLKGEYMSVQQMA
ncbi:hypothetical protein EDD86DRAFT_213167 [Gorgonomyces haynaldii]|nr:hypothetical protein EDD86DRAFT_213167 [Gorgonomyces haynaldii]